MSSPALTYNRHSYKLTEEFLSMLYTCNLLLQLYICSQLNQEYT